MTIKWGKYKCTPRNTRDPEDAFKIRDYITESEQIARDLPPSSYDPNQEALRSALIVAVISTAIGAFSQDVILTSIVTAITLALYAGQFLNLRRMPEINTKTKLYLALLVGLAILIGGVKFCALAPL